MEIWIRPSGQAATPSSQRGGSESSRDSEQDGELSSLSASDVRSLSFFLSHALTHKHTYKVPYVIIPLHVCTQRVCVCIFLQVFLCYCLKNTGTLKNFYSLISPLILPSFHFYLFNIQQAFICLQMFCFHFCPCPFKGVFNSLFTQSLFFCLAVPILICSHFACNNSPSFYQVEQAFSQANICNWQIYAIGSTHPFVHGCKLSQWHLREQD